jgi:hypothetical protein
VHASRGAITTYESSYALENSLAIICLLNMLQDQASTVDLLGLLFTYTSNHEKNEVDYCDWSRRLDIHVKNIEVL